MGRTVNGLRKVKHALDKRLSYVIGSESLHILEIFNAQSLVKLQCGKPLDGSLKYDIAEGETEEYGVQQCQEFLDVVSKVPHIKESDFNFDPRMSQKYLTRIKDAVHAGIWKRVCPEWFVCVESGDFLTVPEELKMKKFNNDPDRCSELDAYFIVAFENSKEIKVGLCEEMFYKSFYSNEQIYKIAERESCILVDIDIHIERWTRVDCRKLL